MRLAIYPLAIPEQKPNIERVVSPHLAAELALEALGNQPTLVSLGNFDGVHLGHRAVLCDSVRVAKERGLIPVALTFDPHPTVAVGRPPPACLTSLDRKLELIQRIDPLLRVVVLRFDKEFAAQSPETFVREVLVGKLRAALVRVGENFRFGTRRSGDLRTLLELGRSYGFETQAEPLLGDSEGRYSSTRARESVSKGELAQAQAILGRPHCLSGEVIEGQKRARQLGFPTANLGWVVEALPRHGVYAAAVDRVSPTGLVGRLGKGVVNIGVRPTVDAGFAVETHLFDFEGDLYGSFLRVHLLEFLRPERRFEGIADLEKQIKNDVVQARQLLSDLRPAAEAGEAWF